MGENSSQSYCKRSTDSSTSPNAVVNLICFIRERNLQQALPQASDEFAIGKNNSDSNLMYVNVI